ITSSMLRNSIRGQSPCLTDFKNSHKAPKGDSTTTVALPIETRFELNRHLRYVREFEIFPKGRQLHTTQHVVSSVILALHLLHVHQPSFFVACSHFSLKLDALRNDIFLLSLLSSLFPHCDLLR